MQAPNKNGIICDHCGTTHTGDFIYYSFDFHNVNVLDNRRPDINSILKSRLVFSLDICQTCFDNISKTVIDNYKKQLNKKKVGTLCELSGVNLVGTYTYYYINCCKVTVKIAGQPNICTSCHTKTWNDKSCEKCGNTKFVKPASINTAPRYLEIAISDDVYTMLRKKAELVCKNTSQWTTGD